MFVTIIAVLATLTSTDCVDEIVTGSALDSQLTFRAA
ncbi:hypothetical protein ACVW1A_001327 [Bradyrhizobium sp. LB1.3]